MTFLTLQQELEDRLGVYDLSVTDQATKLKRWLNMGVQYICGKRLWPFMLATEIIQTVADYTTGTVDVTSTTATFSATITPTKLNHYIQFSSSDDWYKITAHTAGTASATISPAITANGTSLTYKIRKLHYVTTTPMMQILDMKQLTSPVRVIGLNPRENDMFSPLYYDQGTPYCYIVSIPDSSGNQQFSFVNSPDSVLNVMVRGVKVLSDMSADGDTPIIPAPWHDAILNIAAFYGFQTLDDNRADKELLVGEKRISDMAGNYTLDAGRHRIMTPFGVDDASVLKWALPDDFGPEC